MREPAPERVDQLLGRPLAVPHGALAACTLTSLGALAVALVLLPADPALPLALLPCLAIPALVAFRSTQ
jgi:hypothetical protein